MRTAIFFGLIIIADSLGKLSGWERTDKTTPVIATVLLVMVGMDIVDFIIGVIK